MSSFKSKKEVTLKPNEIYIKIENAATNTNSNSFHRKIKSEERSSNIFFIDKNNKNSVSYNL